MSASRRECEQRSFEGVSGVVHFISQVAVAESQHLAQLQLGLAGTAWLADCLAVPKGRSLVGRLLKP